MTEPDEAKQYAQSRIHGAGRAAWMAAPIKDELAMAYRAGQAASAERIKALEEALTPSAGTKYAFLGEFRQAVGSRKVTIEWTTIKEIMQAIRDHADALLKEADQ
jgi:hypothetical protein